MVINKRLNDTSLFILNIIIMALVLFSLYVSVGLLVNLHDTMKQSEDKVKIVVIDSSGNQFTTTVNDNIEDVIEIFSVTMAKKILTYDYVNYKDSLDYLQRYSTDKIYNQWFSSFEKDNKDLIITKSSYKSSIRDYILLFNEEDSSFDAFFQIKQIKTSSSQSNMSKNLLLKIKFKQGSPTNYNNLGFFVTELSTQKLSDIDPEELKKIFGKEEAGFLSSKKDDKYEIKKNEVK
jgi:hypothetical protein